MILDAHSEVFVWVGQHVDAKEKQLAFEIGKKYMERAALLEGLSQDIPLYKVTEGNEPPFFTKYYMWDSAKAAVQGNSFEKKLATLSGIPLQAVENLKKRMSTPDSGSSEAPFSDSSNGSKQSGATQRAAALAALSSAFNSSGGSKPAPRPAKPFGTSNQSSQRAAAVAALSTVLDAEAKKGSPAKTAVVNDKKTSVDTVSEITDNKSDTTVSSEPEELLPKQDESSTQEGTKLEESSTESNGQEVSEPKEAEVNAEENGSSETYSYERLKAKSTNPAPGIDHKKRETYLSPQEFHKIFGMDQKKFYEQPKWKQDMRKRAVDLF
uniref:TSA: Wollemia nobilis Ref_Wollemi_Transcript_12585_2099 transcribed RNA sequence n=1 Tax=Wollemia nobilis TaxID=56998 RepID=A0A0C9S7X8_9CONI